MGLSSPRRYLALVLVLLFAVAFLMLSGLPSPAQVSGSAVGSNAATAAHPVPSALADTLIDLNRSQSSGTYVNEYVLVNNGTTLYKLPASLSVTANACDWITIANTSEAANPASVFHEVQYQNVTTANATGTVEYGPSHTSFRACGGDLWWINYVDWSYSIYRFSTTTLPVNGTVTVGNFSVWPGTTTGPTAVKTNISDRTVVSFKIAANLTAFTVTFESPINGPQNCSDLGQVCGYTEYRFVSVFDSANTSSSSSVHFTRSDGLLVTDAYENWTVEYNTTSQSTSTGLGGFFTESTAIFERVIVGYWYLWVVLLLLVIAGSALSGSRRRR